MSAFAKDYTESIFRAMGHIACIVDRDQVVAASGVSKKELADKPISHDLETAIANRQTVAINRAGGGKIVAVTNEEDITGYTAQVVSPIIADGEAIGAVLLLSKAVSYTHLDVYKRQVLRIPLVSKVVPFTPPALADSLKVFSLAAWS